VKTSVAFVLVGILVLPAPVVMAQSPHTAPGHTSPTELESIKSDLATIKSELEDVKRQLGQILRLVQPRGAQAPAAPPSRTRVNVADAPALGRPDAPVTLVEFSDYQCPFCQQFFVATLQVLKRDYIDTGKVRYVFRDYPLDQIHPQARKAAEAAHCAGDQGKYWEMHDLLFRNQRALTVPQLGEHARAIGLQANAFDACLASGKHAARVGKGLEDGLAAGIQGTPGFVVGKTEPGSSMEGAAVRGAQPVEVFRRLIDPLLPSN
jgi:protein-disulfide isomerase